MILEVRHRTTYRYNSNVSISHHLAHLTPRGCPWQRCRTSVLDVSPAPSIRDSGTDYFGNPVTTMTVQQPHKLLDIVAVSVVDVGRRAVPDAVSTPAWEEVREAVRESRDAEALEAADVAFASPATQADRAIEEWTRLSFPPGRPILEAAVDLTTRIHREFAYRSGSTDVATPVTEAFVQRRGVCQDFTLIALAGLRCLGLPARYVSGYLLTRPAPGRPKLVGADASHAWFGIWVPGSGWIDLDPTNDLVVGDEHVTLAWGRDYGDVTPICGVMFGGGEHKVTVGVDTNVIG